MKKTILAMATAVIMLAGCGSLGNQGGILSGIDGTSILGNVLGSVLGLNKISQENLVGTWKYTGPGCAFTSDNLLAQAGGEVASQKIKSTLLSYYNSVGISSSNTYFTFANNNTFTAKVAGKTISGSYAYDPSTGQMTIKTMLFTLNSYITASTSGISLLFESQKLLTILQTIGGLSGNTTLATIGELSKNYDGVRLGFDLGR
ncbi:MAG: DUF4923 family protein [Prevotella sp.]|nr:DUF4923 family protein [Prevotella sp.]